MILIGKDLDHFSALILMKTMKGKYFQKNIKKNFVAFDN